MKLYSIGLVVLLLIGVSCKQTEQKPEGLLSEETMISMLTDLHTIEAKVGQKQLSADSAKIYFHAFQKQLMKDYKTDTASFNKSYRYYLSQEKLFDKMYSQVVDSLSLKESRRVLK